MDCQYVATQRGGVALVFEGHRYNKVRDGKDGTVYWRCSRDRQCPGRAVTVHSRIKKANNKHNHNPDNGINSKPLLNSNSLLSNQTGSNHHHQNALAAFDVAALLRNSNSGGSNHHSLNHLTNHSPNQTNLHNSSSSKHQQNLTEAAMALLSTNLSNNNLNSKDFNSTIAVLLQQQQQQQQQQKQHILNNKQTNLNNSHQQYNKSTPNEFLKNNLNDRLNTQQQQQLDKDNQQFRDNLLSTGSTNYLSNASSSSASSSPLINLCSGQTPFQNTTSKFNNFNKSSSELYKQFNSSANHLNQFQFMDQFKNNQIKLINSNSSSKQINSSSNLPSTLSYLNNYQNLARLGQQDWLNKMSNQMNNQLNNQTTLNQLTSNGQLNQLFAQFELERLARSNNNELQSHYANGDESSSKKFKLNNDLKIDEKDHNKINGTIKNDEFNHNKKLNNDENKNEESDTKDDFEFDEEDEIENDQNDELDEKQLLNSTNESTSVLDLIKLGRFLNPTTIFDTLNQLSLNNPQMASAFAISLLGQLEQQPNSNLQQQSNECLINNLQVNLESQKQQSKEETGTNLETSQLNLKTKLPQQLIDENEKLKAIDYYSESSDGEEDQPLNMAFKTSGQLLKKLRQLMKNLNYVPEPIQAYIVPTCDAHQSEYIADCDQRRRYLTNFTGSNGTAIITANVPNEEQLLWTDGRYYAQAELQLSDDWKLMKAGQTGVPTQAEYLSKLPNGSKVGFDARLLSYTNYKDLSTTLSSNSIEMVPLMDNLVDILWPDRPDKPNNPIDALDLKFTGLSWQDKIQQTRESMQKKDASILVLSALDEIAYLFNLRGSDVPYNPVFFAYSIITLDSVYLFIEEDQLSFSARKQLGLNENLNSSNNKQMNKDDNSMQDSPVDLNSSEYRIQIRPYASIFESLKEIINTQTGKVWISSESSYSLVNLVPKNRHIDAQNPVQLKKVVKNDVEVNCMRNAHIKDAVALCEFFAWLEEEVPKGTQTEISASEKLFELRKEQAEFVQNSFETISGSGPNGAIIHYKANEASNRSLNIEEIYLCDSGAQYLDGTTDVTRTLHFGTPNDYERQMFTRVAKGHINLASSIFPCGTKGHALDVLARKCLWEVGLDYLHGTGHGVGSYLNVHEGPIGISPNANRKDPGLQEGMILSNEPGYYEQDKFGIRIENLMVVKKKETQYNFNNKGYLCFDTITLVPIQTKLLDPSLLTSEEIEWLDNYHQTCREIVGNALKSQGKNCWL